MASIRISQILPAVLLACSTLVAFPAEAQQKKSTKATARAEEQPVQGASPQKTAASLRAELLKGVKTIAAPGAPGSVCAWGSRSSVIIVGKDEDHDAPVMVVGEDGGGRVALLSHSGYFGKDALATGETAALVANTVKWAGGHAKGQPRVGVVKAAEVLAALKAQGIQAQDLSGSWESALHTVDVLVLGGNIAPRQVEDLQKFIAGGGGFITAQCGWGWKQLAVDKEMRDFELNRVLAPSCMAFTDGFAGRTVPVGFDVMREPTAYAHGGEALRIVLSDDKDADAAVKPKDRAAAGWSAMEALRVLPDDDTVYRPRLATLLDSRKDHLVPSEAHPLREKNDPLDRFLLAYQLATMPHGPAEDVKAHPAAEFFPGRVPSGAARVTKKIAIDTSVPNWHSLGLYADAGDVITVTLPPSALKARLGVRIGCHTDEIWRHGEWKRVPEISQSQVLGAATTKIASPFGGLVYIDVPGGCKLGTIEVTVAGAVESPLFELGKTSPSDWKSKIRAAPGRWAELATQKVIVTMPSERIRELDDPTEVLTFWNSVLDAAADLAVIPHERARPERYVADVQISAGYMHSGYPIMAHLDAGAWLPSITELRTGNWGLYHELGHNHQEDGWTFDGTTEVTCNLFTLYVHDTVCRDAKTDSKRWLADHQKDIAKYLAGGAKFEQWKEEPFTALAMYVQLQQAFGWDVFKKVFKEYRDLPPRERPHGDDQKRDQWMVRFSRAVGKNLGPFFEAWGVPTSKSARDQVSKLPSWMPEGWPPQS